MSLAWASSESRKRCQEMTDVEKLLEEFENLVLIGNEEDRNRYFPALVGIDVQNNRAVYNLEKLIGIFIEQGNNI